MQNREKKMLKTAKKADLRAKSELRFTAGSQGHTKKDWQAKIIQSAPLKETNSNKYRCSSAQEYKRCKLIKRNLTGSYDFEVCPPHGVFYCHVLFAFWSEIIMGQT